MTDPCLPLPEPGSPAFGVGDGRRGLGLLPPWCGFVDREHLTVVICVLVPVSPHFREQMGSPGPGDLRGTLEPKVMKEREGSMGPLGPSACR